MQTMIEPQLGPKRQASMRVLGNAFQIALLANSQLLGWNGLASA